MDERAPVQQYVLDAEVAMLRAARHRGTVCRVSSTRHTVPLPSTGRATGPTRKTGQVGERYWRALLRRRPGGLLLIVDHGSTAPWSWNQDPDTYYPTPAKLSTGLELDPAQWPVLRADMPRRLAIGPGGDTATVTDHVLSRATG